MTRIAHIADLHFGDEDPELVADFLARLPDAGVDVVVIAGDLTQTGSRREFALAAEFLAAMDQPVVLTPGNHDTPLLNIASRLTRPWRRLQKAMAAHAAPSYADEQIQIESFNSARGVQMRLDWSLGVISQRRLEAPMKALADSLAGTKILTAHHPILSPLDNKGRARTHRAPRFARQIAETADLILTGHLHQHFACPVEEEGRTSWFVGVSTAFSSRTREDAPGFNLIDVADTHFELHRFDAIQQSVQRVFEQTSEMRLERS